MIDNDTLLTAFEDGSTIEELASRYNTSPDTILGILRSTNARGKGVSKKRDQMAEFRRLGFTFEDIGAIYGVSRQAIQQLIPHIKKGNSIDETAIIEQFHAGNTVSALAKMFDMKYYNIRTILLRNGIDVRKKKITKDIESKVINNYLDGMPLSRIKKENELGEHHVRGILKNHKVLFPRDVIPDKIYSALCSRYQAGDNLNDIAMDFKIPKQRVMDIVQDAA